ncbi:MAG: tRNA pseudouridine(38-40) synthase TruA [Firmicutes bacterium]|nr:tRNA pseudouridine(38-40) synthase TruA [Bacillota bacterium]
MMFSLGDLTEDCGLKYNKTVILNRPEVFAFCEEHQEWFEDIVIPFHKDGMTYGWLADGQMYKIGVKNGKIERIVIVTKVQHSKRMMMKITYDGTEFSGFQIQSKDRSVQGEIEKIVSEIHQEPTRISGASRTDAGVHALAQVIHFDTDREETPERWLYYLNKRLPKDIHVMEARLVHPLFHSRYDVLKKEYRYRLNLNEFNPLNRHFEWYVGSLDMNRLQEECACFIGTHDFTSFSKGEKDSKIRTIYKAEVQLFPNYVEIVFEGDGFLRYMIRLMVFSLVKIAQGNLKVSVQELLEEKSRKRTIHLAPAGGLYLSRVDYE